MEEHPSPEAWKMLKKIFQNDVTFYDFHEQLEELPKLENYFRLK